MLLKHDAQTDWKRYGDHDPYFGVLSDPRFRGKTLDGSLRQEFFASGKAHAENLLQVIGQTLHDCPRGEALDFGCGVGRLTQGLAQFFSKVVGLDVAPGMIAEARRNAEIDGVSNVEYHSSLDMTQFTPRRYDLVHSYIVLQHIPVQIGEAIIKNLIEAVSEGGIGALHITILPAKGSNRIALRNWIKRNKLMRLLANLAMRHPLNSPAMEMNMYRVERIIEMLAQSGIERFSCLRVDDWGSIGLFVLFRRDSSPTGKVPWSNPVN
jgi:2-polyprenyl-3-methyl-5-hydroxy-6-metoxy-1,4-benzoquinol methylase